MFLVFSVLVVSELYNDSSSGTRFLITVHAMIQIYPHDLYWPFLLEL